MERRRSFRKHRMLQSNANTKHYSAVDHNKLTRTLTPEGHQRTGNGRAKCEARRKPVAITVTIGIGGTTGNPEPGEATCSPRENHERPRTDMLKAL